MNAIVIAGTDTDVGKTVFAAALAGALGCFTGCSGESKPAAGHEAHAHHHEPPHGGTAIDLGDAIDRDPGLLERARQFVNAARG